MISAYNREFEKIESLLESFERRLIRLEAHYYNSTLRRQPRTEQESYERATGIK